MSATSRGIQSRPIQAETIHPLVTMYGFDIRDPVQRRKAYDIKLSQTHPLMRNEVRTAMRLASEAYGQSRKPPRTKVQPGAGPRNVASWKNFGVRLQELRARGNLRGAADLQRQWRQAQHATKQKKKRPFGQHDPKAHGLKNLDVQENVATGAGLLVEALESLMEASGGYLSKAIHRELVRKAGGRVTMGAAIGVALTPEFLYQAVITRLVRSLGIPYDREQWAEVVRDTRGIVSGLLRGKRVRLRPLVEGVIRSIDSVYLVPFAKNIVRSVLDSYVYTAYASTSSNSVICQACRGVTACQRNQNAPTNVTRAQGKLQQALQKALNGLKRLLRVQNTTLDATLRAGLDTYAPGLAQRLVAVIGYRPVTLGVTVATAMRIPLTQVHPVADTVALGINWFAKPYGLEITGKALATVLWTHEAAIRSFINRRFDKTIEPLLIDVVVAMQPIGLLRGVHSAALGGRKASRAFCTMCTTKCGSRFG